MLRDVFFKYWYDFMFGFFFAGLGIGFRWVVKTIKQLMAENDAHKAASRSMLRDRIVQAYTFFSARQC